MNLYMDKSVVMPPGRNIFWGPKKGIEGGLGGEGFDTWESNMLHFDYFRALYLPNFYQLDHPLKDQI